MDGARGVETAPRFRLPGGSCHATDTPRPPRQRQRHAGPAAARAARPEVLSAPATSSARPSGSAPPAGQQAEPFINRGQLVPDDLVNELVAELLPRQPRPDRFVMDGYPRTLAQAVSFDALLADLDLTLTAVIQLDVTDEEVVRRITGRRVCPNQRQPSTTLPTGRPRRPACATSAATADSARRRPGRSDPRAARGCSTRTRPHWSTTTGPAACSKVVPAVGSIETIY